MIYIGTSGYSYPEWRGSFYPADLPTSKMLSYYAARFTTVEINNTFYRLPSEKLLAGWAEQTPPGFALNFPRYVEMISLFHRLADIVPPQCPFQRRR